MVNIGASDIVLALKGSGLTKCRIPIPVNARPRITATIFLKTFFISAYFFGILEPIYLILSLAMFQEKPLRINLYLDSFAMGSQ